MMVDLADGIPSEVRGDLDTAIRLLLEAGCSEVFLFGSAAYGTLRDDSDLDLAIRGCPPREFFFVYSKLRNALGRPVDLIDLDDDTPFVRHLKQKNRLLRIA